MRFVTVSMIVNMITLIANNRSQQGRVFKVALGNTTPVGNGIPMIVAIKVESQVIGYSDGGSTMVHMGQPIKLCLIGKHLEKVVGVFFITGNSCNESTDAVNINEDKLKHVGQYELIISDILLTEVKEYGLCMNYESKFQSFINNSRMRIIPQEQQKEYIMGSLAVQLLVCVFLAMLSGLFSGLNLGLMSLTPEELELVMTASGDANHRRYAETILPVRRQGNYLLCSLLFGNVIVNTVMSILFGDIVDSLMAICISTMVIVIFGEIIPQSACQKYSLAVGAKTIYITMFFMIITGPLSFPMGKILDFALQQEYNRTFQRERLYGIMKAQLRRDMEEKKGTFSQEQEMKVFQKAMSYADKTVKDVMTTVEDVFMIEEQEILDRDTVVKITSKGFTRIPVYKKDRDNITYMLHVKDLALFDPDDKLPAFKVAKIWHRNVTFTEEDVKLTAILAALRRGESHISIVKKDGKVIGLVTLEDVIEEILGMEIYDETDAKKARKQRRSSIKNKAREVLGPSGGSGKSVTAKK